MRIGVDFDNTIVCYDDLFHRVAREQGLIPAEIHPAKSSVRDYLRKVEREDDWTQLEGYVYGSRMSEAAAYPGVCDFFARCRESRIDLCIISHKTKEPFQGPQYDLHDAAYSWLEQKGFLGSTGNGIGRQAIYFELTKQEKLQRIRTSGCDHFIDDLPEFLSEPHFPAEVDRILFDPGDLYQADSTFRRVKSWAEISKLVFAN